MRYQGAFASALEEGERGVDKWSAEAAWEWKLVVSWYALARSLTELQITNQIKSSLTLQGLELEPELLNSKSISKPHGLA